MPLSSALLNTASLRVASRNYFLDASVRDTGLERAWERSREMDDHVLVRAREPRNTALFCDLET